MGWRYGRSSTIATLDLKGPTAILWIIAIVSYGVGDIVTTVIGLSSGSLVETSPLVIPMIQRFGLSALVGMKVLVFGFTGLLWWVTPYPDSLGVPLGLTIIGVLVTGWNMHLLLLHGF